MSQLNRIYNQYLISYEAIFEWSEYGLVDSMLESMAYELCLYARPAKVCDVEEFIIEHKFGWLLIREGSMVE